MKYALELPIHRPLEEVWKAFDDRQNMSKWQPTLVEVETIRGIQGQPGAVSRLTFEENGRKFSLMETITRRDEPHRLDTLYENEFAANTVSNRFTEQGPAETLWIVETEYRFKTVIMRVLGPLLKKNFVARTQREMERFKAIAEKQPDNS
jgi:uncharacterized protein YndB with AHSA1/START domain